jgi:hypothetical protein
MSNMQRNKGRAGEQEVSRLIRDWLGIDVRRNWQAQSAEGGADLAGIPGWAVEVKFADLFRSAWWRQACEQAERASAKPALVYRLTGQGRGKHPLEKWRVVLRLSDISSADIDSEHSAEISLRAWIDLVRESMDTMTALYRLTQPAPAPPPSQGAGSIPKRSQSAT